MWDKNWLTRHGGVLLALTLVACGGSDEGDENGAGGLDEATVQSFEALYRLDSFTENPSSCDAEGPSTLATVMERNFVTVGGSFFGQRFLQLVSCSDDNCPMKTAAIRNNGIYSIEYSVTLSGVAGPDELTGFQAGTGFGMDDRCVEREYVTHALTRTGDTVRVNREPPRSRTLPKKTAFAWSSRRSKRRKPRDGRARSFWSSRARRRATCRNFALT